MSVLPTVDNAWGAAFIGLLLAAVLYGITCLQTYIYFTTYPEDGWEYKTMAGTAFVLDTTSLALISSAIYGYLITDMYAPLNLLFVNRAFDIEPSIMGLLAFLTHLYLGNRVWKVCNRNLWLGILLGTLLLTTLSLAFASTVVSWKHRTWISLKTSIRPLALAGIITSVLLDTTIASVLCLFLVRHVREVEGKKTRRLVRKLLVFAINTGLASSLLSILNLAMFFAFPDTMIFLCLTLIYSKVYANALLANLNSREHLRCSLESSPSDCDAVSLNLSAFKTCTPRPQSGRSMELHTIHPWNETLQDRADRRDDMKDSGLLGGDNIEAGENVASNLS
ncbi:hypothetical protein DFP72DRAFT_511465 [Ephemerocybe angulata]|uniref:DUF6534 domain-containing protein n=1 Tax=Ephemerocybe angulata TaxID=980116 RepID=A0A8H6HP31_9AGAR|nr:hypothetical protein DFP72DRAFT_511465 [Tulosesus angulatus]